MHGHSNAAQLSSIFVCWIGLLPYFASGQAKHTASFSLTGQLPRVSEGKVYLLDKNDELIDSGSIKGIRFALRGSLPEPGLYQIKINQSEKTYPIFLEDSPIRVTLQDEEYYQVTGSAIHTQWEQYNRRVGQIKQQLIRLYQARDTARLKADTVLLDRLNRQNDSVSRYYGTYLREQIAQQPYSYFNLYLLHQARLGEIYTASMLDEFRPYLAHYPTFQHFDETGIPRRVTPQTPLLGQKAYEFVLPDSMGSKHSLVELRNQGKLVLVKFWASWCLPCIEQLPGLKALQERFERQGLVIVNISIDNDGHQWRKALQRYQPAGLQLLSLDKSPLLRQYRVNSVPYAVLIDPSGRIQGDNLGVDELSEKVSALLTKQSKADTK